MGYYSRLGVELLGKQNQAQVLRFLYRNKPNRFSQKQISDALHIPPATISRTCRKLMDLNIVEHFSMGKTILYCLDESSYFTKKILVPVFRNEQNLFHDLIKDIINTLNRKLAESIKEILLFGSILRDEDTPESDIDLAVVIKRGSASHVRTAMPMRSQMESIEEHFVNESTKLKLRLDIHLFIEGEVRKNKRGISLAKVYEEGITIWKYENEKPPKRRL